MTKEELFNENINIAYKIANKYKINYPEEYEDIKQVALMGLWCAILRYNYKFKLSTFAYIVIHSRINIYLRDIVKRNGHVTCFSKLKVNDNQFEHFQEIIEDPEDHIFDLLENIELKDILNRLKTTDEEDKIISLRMEGKSQAECR